MNPKEYSTKDLIDCLKLLCQKFPKAFNIHDPKPLKINIHEDIKKRLKNMDENILLITLKIYTGKPKYLQSVIDETYRINLYGDQGKKKILKKHKDYARDKLLEISQKLAS